jgi:hypothetical protein
MRFLIAGEGLTDFVVLKSLLIGFFNDKNLSVNRLLPKDKEPVGWGNVLKFLPTQEFQNGVENSDYTIVQIDTKECEEWNEGLKNIGDDKIKVADFIKDVISVLIKKMGCEFHSLNSTKIMFAITVHDMECWLLPFNTNTPAHQSKMVNCVTALEQIANKRGFSIHQKNNQDSKYYIDFSKDMKNNKELMKQSKLNPSLQIFIKTLEETFPSTLATAEGVYPFIIAK